MQGSSIRKHLLGLHDQKGHGLWTDPSYRGAREVSVGPGGGFTIDPVSGRSPTTGKVVGIPGHEESFELGSQLRADIDGWRERHAEALKGEGAHIGGWFDEDTGQAVLDVAIVVDTVKEARRLMEKFKQKAYYDLDRKREVRKGKPKKKFLLPADASTTEILAAIDKVAGRSK